MKKRLRCFFGAHRWAARQYENGRPYKKCQDCGTICDPLPFLGWWGG